MVIKRPELGYSRKYLDFGSGFYLTNLRNQAVYWAKRVCIEKGGNPCVSMYELDTNDLTGHTFKGISKPWIDCILANRVNLDSIDKSMRRNLISTLRKYAKLDYIEGEVADDIVYSAIMVFCEMLIDARSQRAIDLVYELFATRIRYKNKNHQICLRTNLALSKLKWLKGVRL